MKHCNSSPVPRSFELTPKLVLISLLLLLPGTLIAAGEERFGSPEAAVDALKAAVEVRDTNALHAIFGPAGHALVSVDVVEAAEEHELFMSRVKEKINLVAVSDSKQELQLGADGWPFPIPLVKQDGQWLFDIEAGKEEILNRRIGANELGAIQVCRAYVQAQREYAGADHNADEVLEYAQHLRSHARDGPALRSRSGRHTSG